MIASYPDRVFQTWEYRVSHGSLLIRSPKGPDAVHNIDVVFDGVEYLSLPRFLHGLVLAYGTCEDLVAAGVTMHEVAGDRVYVLVSQGQRHYVVASSCRVNENDGDIFDSPFEDSRIW